MKKFLHVISNLDRRIIFIFVFFAVLIPFLVPFKLPIKANKNVISVHKKIDEISGGTALVCFDFDPAAKAELEPMAKAVISHMFKRKVKVVAMTNIITGVALHERILEGLAKEYNAEYGKDWVFLGWKPGFQILILQMGTDFQGAFPKDARGNDIRSLEVTRNILGLRDFDFMFEMASSGAIDVWIDYGQSRYGFPMAGGVTAVMAPDYFPQIQSGQLVGLLGGLVGAAQYEYLIDRPGAGLMGMNSQSITHIMLIFFIIVGNIGYFVNRFFGNKES